MHIHLDTLGGISGNMFIGALLDVWPQLAPELPGQLERAGFAELVTLDIVSKNDGVLTGTHVETTAVAPVRLLQTKQQEYPHRSWQEIRRILASSSLEPGVKAHALGIFGALAAAEAQVHGKAVEEVDFHEVGAWDSIADVVCAAFLIERSGATSWSVSSLPLGRGLIATAHGQLPVPAPAVTLLLQGFRFHDDGREGERVTPTGAAILNYLKATQDTHLPARVLQHSGHGFGSRGFPGISNVLRVLVFSAAEQAFTAQQDTVAVLSFEVDDQTPEELALALAALREQPGVLDVVQYPVHGKKHRLASSVRVLVRPGQEESVTKLCFMQTTTLGVRLGYSLRKVLRRSHELVELDGRAYRVKLTLRPDGALSAKVEAEDLAGLGSQAQRQQVRAAVEALVLERNAGQDADAL
jgi:hypothetical protein